MSQAAPDTVTEGHHHVMPLKIYLAVGAALLVLTLITVEVAQHDFGAMNVVIALLIASVKALLVAFFFMHLWYDNKLLFTAFAIGLITLTVFIVLTMADTMERGRINPESKGPIDPQAEMYSAPGFGQGGHGAGDTTAAHDTTFVDTTSVDTAAVTDTVSSDSDADAADQGSSSH